MAGARLSSPPPRPLLALVSLLSVLATFVPLIPACSTPPAGCTKDQCNRLYDLTPPYQSKGGSTADKRIGWIYGVYNKNLPAGSSSQKGGGIVNWEVFPGIDYNYVVTDSNKVVVDTRGIYTLGDCCHMCAKTDGCRVYQFWDSMNWKSIKLLWDSSGAQYPSCEPLNFWGDRQCYLFTGGVDNLETSFGAPYSGPHSQQQATAKNCWEPWPNKMYPPSWVGGACNGNVSVVDDPHFTGAKGTRFEFNGEIDRTFTLITDERLNVNIKLGGYLDERTFGATKRRDGKAMRTWIRELGFIWRDMEGAQHTAVLVARTGMKMERGTEGFLSSITIDGSKASVPKELKESVDDGLFSLTLLQVSRKGPFDIETYELTVKGLIVLTVKLRAAHPMLQSDKDAYVHFNVHVHDLEATSRVHGVLGQTYRTTMSQTVKALEYRLLSKLIGQPVVADGESGKGFLDGEPSDYATSSLLATDSKFSSFQQ